MKPFQASVHWKRPSKTACHLLNSEAMMCQKCKLGILLLRNESIYSRMSVPDTSFQKRGHHDVSLSLKPCSTASFVCIQGNMLIQENMTRIKVMMTPLDTCILKLNLTNLKHHQAQGCQQEQCPVHTLRYFMASSARKQDKTNPVFWLAFLPAQDFPPWSLTKRGSLRTQ